MNRLEIICNSALVEDVLEGFDDMEQQVYYSRINGVHGTGSSGPRMGDHIWPEENVLFLLYCEDAQAQEIRHLVEEIKQRFPDTGIKLFET